MINVVKRKGLFYNEENIKKGEVFDYKYKYGKRSNGLFEGTDYKRRV